MPEYKSEVVEAVNIQYSEEDKPDTKEAEILEENTEACEPDTEPPILVTGSVVTVKVGSERVPAPMICVDNVDRVVNCTVEGSYDLNTVGTYNLVRVAVDSAGNTTRFPFKLNVVEEVSKSENSSQAEKISISDFISLYKNENTSIGIDVSKWQGDIDWQKVKDAGVEFVIIRLGVQNGFLGEPILDDYFIQNYKGAKAAGLKVGAYFYSYAMSASETKTQAEFVLSVLKENSCKLDLPIAYDWESWSRLTSLGINIVEFNNLAKVFLDTLNSAGYDVMLYSSKYYIEKTLWRLSEESYPIWLAHYTNKNATTYTGGYKLWQCSCVGSVPGINGYVDIDVLIK